MPQITAENQPAFLHALLRGDRHQCSQIAAAYSGSHESIKVFYEEVVKPSMYAIGVLWEEGRISVATEHLASAIVEGVMNELYLLLARGRTSGRTLVAACVEEEKHQIGLKMVADVFEMHGWKVYFLGAELPCQELIRFMRALQPDALALSLSIYFHLPTLEQMLVRIRQAFPGMYILVGGQAFCYGGREVLAQYPGVGFVGDLDELNEWLNTRGSDG